MDGVLLDRIGANPFAQRPHGTSRLAATFTTSAPDRRISFRIGIHIGDVMVRAGDLFGDGVNIAARLQTLANPGTVCISGPIRYARFYRSPSLTLVLSTSRTFTSQSILQLDAEHVAARRKQPKRRKNGAAVIDASAAIAAG